MEQSSQIGGSSSKNQKKEKVLIAISDPNLANLISAKFKQEGYSSVFTVSDGNQVLQEMRVKTPDIAIIDLVMPGKDGYDILNEKSFDRFITKIPVIVVSNSSMPVEVRRIPSTSSVKDYVVKTHVDPEEVFKKSEIVFGYADRNTMVVPEKKKPIEKGPSRKVLWVEDDKLLGSILLKKFESYGHKVFRAENGNEALDYLKNEKPDIIFLDILLPDVDGFDVLQKIKMDDKLRSIPTVILSNMSKPSDKEKAKVLGADRYLVKAAASLDEIVKTVDVLTNK